MVDTSRIPTARHPAWMVYLLAQQLGYGVYSMNFFATLVAALYAETMARILD